MFLRIFGVGWGSVFTSVGLLVMYGYVLMGFGGVILVLDILGGIYLVVKSRRKEL